VALLAAFQQPLHFDMDALAGRRAMALPRREQRSRLFGAASLDEPFLEPRHQHRRMENSSPALTKRLWLRYELSGKGSHLAVPGGGESDVCKYFTVKLPRRTNHKRDGRCESVLVPERGIIDRVVSMLVSRS
jgi:hypothetical protein